MTRSEYSLQDRAALQLRLAREIQRAAEQQASRVRVHEIVDLRSGKEEAILRLDRCKM